MGFDAAFRTTHGQGCFGYVQSLPVTQQEGFPLTRGEIFQGRLDQVQGFSLQQGGMGCRKSMMFFIYFKGFERIALFVVARVEGGKLDYVPRPGAGAAIRVADGILQDALKQWSQFLGRPVAIFLGKPHHAVLHDIEGGFLVAHGENRLFEGAPLDAGEEVGKLGA